MSALRSLGVIVVLGALSAPHALAAPRAETPRQTDSFDFARFCDPNELELAVTNFGSFGFDLQTGSGGCFYPAGTGQSVLFAAGLWVGARVNGEPRVTVAEYSSEYLPGPILPNGLPDDFTKPEHVVYKVVRFTGNPQDTAHVDRFPGGSLRDPLAHHSWSEYMFGAAPYGAPWMTYRLPDTSTPDPNDSLDVPGPDVRGDQMLWAVYNDADAGSHTNGAGNTAPLGIEVRQSVWAVAGPSPSMSRFVFLRFEIENKGQNLLQDTHVSLWSDPDLGGFTDDLVASKPDCDLGYCYNATNADLVYGTAPPALGFVLLETPSAGGTPLGMTAFSKYIGGTDPSSALESFNYMNGLLPDGSPVIDPTTGNPTTYFVPGDPITGAGWVDINPADRRMMLTSGPFPLAPGETMVLTAVLAIGQGSDRLSSIQAMEFYLNQAFALCEGPPTPPSVTNCPQPSEFWARRCQNPTPNFDLASIAMCANDRSTYFEWPSDGSGARSAFCGTSSWPTDAPPRVRAEGEFAVFLANYCAGGQTPGYVPPIRLLPGTSISCPVVPATTIGELATTAASGSQLIAVDYQNEVTLNRRALAGVDWNGNAALFFGGAGYAFDFFGSSIDPNLTSDFPDVEIRFTAAGAGQRAYRFLRRELPDGSSPNGGRGYLYGGFVEVPFQVWDVTHATQLEAAFVERVVTDTDGNPLPADQQPATLDETWGPDDSELGSREYLFVLQPAYTGVAQPAIAYDGAIADGTLPALYALWARLRSAIDLIDPGDWMRFDYGVPPTPGADALMIALAGQPQDDPATLETYTQLADCLAAINAGTGLVPSCKEPTPALPSVYDARVVDGVARVRWLTSDGPGVEGVVQRRSSSSGWMEIARVTSDATGFFEVDDPLPSTGDRFGYRLGLQQEAGLQYYGEVWLDAPAIASIALGAIASPIRGDLEVAVTLRAGSASLELLDVRGRSLMRQRLERAEAGSERVRLAAAGSLRSGVYVVRLTQGGRSAQAKAVLLR